MIDTGIYRHMTDKHYKLITSILGNIRRFDDKENGADYYAGWDNCLDTLILDFADILKANNPKFNRDKFKKTCGFD